MITCKFRCPGLYCKTSCFSATKRITHTDGGADPYRMFADLDHSHPAVRSDIFNWGAWITSTLKLGGMRLDAIKHYSISFLADFISHLDAMASQGERLFFVGEYWDSNVDTLVKVIKKFRGRLNLFDVQLVYTFSDFSKGRKKDLRTIFDGTLVQIDHAHAVVSRPPSCKSCKLGYARV